MLDTIAIEDQKVPTVGLANDGFMNDAKSAAAINGMPGARIIAETVPVECTVPEIIEAGIDAAMDDIVDALIRPTTEEETSPKPEETEVSDRIAFRGSIEEVNRFFYKRKWTDGLPILPPTDAAVAEMLTGTDLPADHLMGKLTPRFGKITVEKIAINAVMAGALPTYMPVLIAAVEALLNPKADYGTYSVSTGSWAPHWIINGPIRHDLNLNSGSGMLSPGDIANSAIGRAMLLIIRNIGGARKGIEDMGVLGNPGKYAAVMVENEEESPWQPLHTEAGFSGEDSAVSVFFPNSFSQIWPYATNAEGVLNSITANVIPGRNGLFCVVMNPANAKLLAEAGWEKDQIRSFISEYARVPAYKSPTYWGSVAGRQLIEWMPLNPMDSQRILRKPEWIKILVAGGAGAFMGLLTGGSINEDLSWVHHKIELPANWDALKKKYGRI
ncbi:MAG: hypothetical protein QGH73_02090 [Rhodospirillales bacterium]|nr:hypothetical protein [Rhodospirillales bacterium]MDP6644871.1 hypothetical protein [Rhodospirillales bacterium]MDP6840445.1 hypothetical protein [Rhodospirillales bacterium]